MVHVWNALKVISVKENKESVVNPEISRIKGKSKKKSVENRILSYILFKVIFFGDKTFVSCQFYKHYIFVILYLRNC